MPRRPEQQPPVVLSERRIIGIHGDGIGRRLLHRERNIVTNAETFFIKGHLLGQQGFETVPMLGRNGKMDLRLPARRSIGGTLDQMLLDSLARPLGIGMERHQPFGFAAVAEALAHDGADHGLVAGPLGQDGPQFGPESEILDMLQQGIDPLAALALVDELEQLLEHARSSARSRHELHDGEPSGSLVITGGGPVGLSIVQYRHTVAGRSGPHDLKIRKSAAEVLDLPTDRLGRKTVPGDLLKIIL